jgi:hypothetical protein
MRSSKQKILDAVVQGRWVVHELAPVFHRRLAESLFKQTVWPGSTKSLSLLFYGYAKHPNEVADAEAGLFLSLNNRSAGLFERIVKNVFKSEAELCNFSHTEVAAIDASSKRLNRAWPCFGEAFSLITLFVRATGANVLGASYPHTFGVVYYGDRLAKVDESSISVSLAHELAHQELFLINLYDRLVCPHADSTLRYAPLQKRARPPIGRLHAFYALFRMIQAKRRLGLDYDRDLKLLDLAHQSLESDELTGYAKSLSSHVMDHVCSM